MNSEDEDEFFVEPEVEEVQSRHNDDSPRLPPPAPTRPKKSEDNHLKMIKIVREDSYHYQPFRLKKQTEQDIDSDTNQQTPTLAAYKTNGKCVFRRQPMTTTQIQGHKLPTGTFFNPTLIGKVQSKEPQHIQDILQLVEDRDYDEECFSISENLKEGQLKFESKFEGGNLFWAYKINEFEYNLAMANDTNSGGSQQWFFFSVQGMRPRTQYKFNIVNFTKTDSLFNYGMKPAVSSHAESSFRHWSRQGSDVIYRRGKMRKQGSNQRYYELSFKLSTPHLKDKLLVAHSYPYTTRNSQRFIERLMLKNKQIIKKEVIGLTPGNRPIECYVVGQPINVKRDNRKAVVIMARQHPGEPQGSLVWQGLVNRLVSRSKQSEYLLKNVIFVMFPMINSDGVAFGHYRGNLMGRDLNRSWHASHSSTPEVTSIKQYLQKLQQQRQIIIAIDLHGHSRKMNSFFYGNPCRQQPDFVKLFPFICSKLHSGIQFRDCTFSIEEGKRKAARVCLPTSLKNLRVYTFESSFYAYFDKKGHKIQFTPDQYRNLGATLTNSLYMMIEYESSKVKDKGCHVAKWIAQLKNCPDLLYQGDCLSEGSDSHPQEGQIPLKELQKLEVRKKTPLQYQETSFRSVKVRRKPKEPIHCLPRAQQRGPQVMQLSKVNSALAEDLGLRPNKPVKSQQQMESCSLSKQERNTKIASLLRSINSNKRNLSFKFEGLHGSTFQGLRNRPSSLIGPRAGNSTHEQTDHQGPSDLTLPLLPHDVQLFPQSEQGRRYKAESSGRLKRQQFNSTGSSMMRRLMQEKDSTKKRLAARWHLERAVLRAQSFGRKY